MKTIKLLFIGLFVLGLTIVSCDNEIDTPIIPPEEKYNDLFNTTWKTHTIVRKNLDKDKLYTETFHYSALKFGDTIFSKIDYVTTNWYMVEWDSTLTNYFYSRKDDMIILIEINDTLYTINDRIKFGEGNLSNFEKVEKNN